MLHEKSMACVCNYMVLDMSSCFLDLNIVLVGTCVQQKLYLQNDAKRSFVP